jgi:hypothetical protein
MKKEKEAKIIDKPITVEAIRETLDAVAQNVVGTQSSYMHSMILLDQLFRDPSARELFDADLKEQAKDLWLKIKSTGLQLNDPPLLFDSN